MKKDTLRQNKDIFQADPIPGMEAVEQMLHQAVSDSHHFTNKICTDLIEAGGKRVRPLLVLSSAQCFGSLNQETVYTAVACELIHMASLVHDDVIDLSKTRRNKPTLNVQIGNHASVLVGDYLFAKAFEILSANKLLSSMNLVVEAIGEMCDGEIVQADNKFNLNQTMEDYYSRIYKKTGILIAACCQAGAIVGGAEDHEVEAFREYGKNIGYAFQIIDDLLDFTGNEKIMGKPVGCDLREGNITLPVLKLIAQAEYKQWIQGIFEQGNVGKSQYLEILRLMKDSYALEESYQEAVVCVEKAKAALGEIKDSPNKNMLLNLADKIIRRKN
ncbi:hypothetical protein Gferi_13165 [Geosporobacter ferrireducens]|uniref:Heptaprenyl diphosphate synthase n=1 Tax=Geosporobacter ferrireducens TaxID=1424294 RepID=A0A1D8GQ85_9FIRM|nr:hypothetical protein Gferi_13165 [Geosporobacter ferrireducens]